ncbi:hypothetical protein P0W64_20225 [Tsukamurella sp. 8F]|uniref:hypothetical protein n=1 Tax=unclassified Tsukamurella TaxID=2633480 RepID=UPI0023B9E6EC|nr:MULTISPECIES: hypothetical protein [unclassified Tsukamurella]MDF0531877.1 hypothetical protein [Tsukamurella sp. 8J]MDF0589111.1 hypothetical protein [Tsukamurella sp. 8F]
MRNGFGTIGKTVALALVVAGAAALSSGPVAAAPSQGGGFPGGPTCSVGSLTVKAESAQSKVVVCHRPYSIDYQYQGEAKSTGATVTIDGARYASGGYHAFNNGYAYHVRPDRLEILAPDGAVVSSEPWTSYVAY